MRNFKKLLLPAVVVLALAAVNFCLDYALIPYSYVRIMMHQIETQEYDTLFLGTSHGLNGISPKIIEEKTGGRAMNLCLGGEYPKDAYYLLKQACKKAAPKRWSTNWTRATGARRKGSVGTLTGFSMKCRGL